MKFGILIPGIEIGPDVASIRDLALGAEAAGFDYVAMFEHVLGAAAERFESVDVPHFGRPPYLYDSPFHEPLTLYAHLAALTSRLEFITAVLVVPQRQTALVAKQAAELDLLSGGRFIMGAGIGWNHAEYEGLGVPFGSRASRLEEQIEVLRLLWREPLVSFEGRFHHLDRVGINPLPSRPVPIWLGGGLSEPVMRRVARLADGWIPSIAPDADLDEVFGRMRDYLAAEGRDMESLPVVSAINAAASPERWLPRAARLAALGVTHFSISAPWQDAAQTVEAASQAREKLQSELG